MIYLFNDVKELTGTVRNNHILNLLYEREKNGIYSVSAEIPVTYNDQGTIYNYNKKIQKSDFLGHYDKEGRFQLHKIAAVDIENGSIFIKGIHIFFDEAKAGAIIKDRRFVNREIIDGARVAFESIGWSVVDFDVSVGKTYNFYNVTPLEARQILVETFGFEFDYWLDFDGKKVTNRHVAVKEKIGEKTNKRYTYGHNVLNIRAEQDYSEIYTAVIGRGKGEEIEETGGYGRRIEYTDVVWTTPSKPLNKPAGSRVLEDPNATQLFGYKENGVVKPRIKVEVFSDIESPTELIQASYEWLMDNNVPKAVFSLKVADGDGLNLGDEVYVIYRDIDLVKSARVEKVIDDLVSGNRDVEFGDTAYFDTDRRLSGLRKDLKRYSGETGDRIYRLKMEFNRRFDEEVSSWIEEFEQNLIDQKAQIEADRENMTNLIEGTRTEFTDNLNAEITQTKEYAEQQAQEKAESVRTDLEKVTSGHQALIDGLKDNVMSIDEFIGDKTTPLNKILLDERVLIEDKINSISTWHYNLLRGSRFDEQSMYSLSLSRGEIITTESIPFFRNNLSSAVPYIGLLEEFSLDGDKEYTFSIDYRTNSVIALNYVTFISRDGTANVSLHSLYREGNHNELVMDGGWRRAYFRFTPPRDLFGTLRIGVNFNAMGKPPSQIDLRLPYLTETDRTQWLYHQLDNTQSMEEVTRRITELEDGREEFITRTVYDSKTKEIEGTIRNIRETVDESESIISNHENWFLTNGSRVLQSADEVSSKVWLSDIHNPNIIPHSEVQILEHRIMWDRSLSNATGTSYVDWMQITHTDSPRSYIGVYSPEFEIEAGQSYTFTFESWENGSDSSNTSGMMDYVFIVGDDITNTGIYSSNNRSSIGTINGATIYRNDMKFTASESSKQAQVLLGTRVTTTGQHSTFRFRNPKLEVGARATPYHNAFSNLSQRADELSLAVQGIDVSGFLSQSDIQIVPDYVQLGSQRIDGSNIGALLRVSPTGIDAVAEAMRLSGDLYVDGDITALAVDAIEGNFARLFANQLTANVITSDHIQVGTALIDKFFATSARIDRLITKTHFVNEMHALTLNVVELNASHIRSRLLTANTIEAEWIKSGTALLDRVFASTAMFERMMAKSGFVTTLNTVTIDTDQLTIRRPDGVAWVSNGMARFDIPVQVQEYMDTSVEWTGQRYVTNSRSAQKCAILYTSHAGRYLRIGLTTGMRYDAQHASTHMGVVIRPENSPSGTNWQPMIEKKIVYKSGNDYQIYEIDLGKPTFAAASFALEFYRIGDNVTNPVTLRIHRAWITG